MDLATTYLGLPLAHPLVMGASPLVDDLDTVRGLEDAGVAAIVMHSLFEEQLTLEQLARHHCVDSHGEAFAEALSYLPEPEDFALGPDAYLEQLRRVKDAVSVPVIGSLNGVTNRGWLEYARLIEEAGADALELNVYALVTDPERSAESVEAETAGMLQAVRAATRLPIAVKLSPFYTALPHFARRLEAAGAAGLVLFNRFYQPDIDVEALEVSHQLHLSTSSELLLRLRWLAVLSPQLSCSLAVTGGVHDVEDVVKAVMAGAHGVQMVSEILQHGPRRFADLIDGLTRWLEVHEYDSLAQMRGSMNLARSPDPAAFERANYVRVLQSWRRAAE
ncbi:MAG TPA: dihydroorotate dehydrogenase-like protein [Polyangiaceae bacterium]|jgi:dihydroorotate dehydrogenase (fumarate)